jgi:uncharacterized membrane protein YkvA (DUF1232 family)
VKPLERRSAVEASNTALPGSKHPPLRSSAYLPTVVSLRTLAVSLVSVAIVYAACVVLLVVLGRRSDARALARFVPDCVVLMGRLLRDARVAGWRKLLVAVAIGYLAMPIDLVPDFIPIAGQLDDAIIVALVLRAVIRGGNAGLLDEHWPGPHGSLRVIHRVAFGSARAL